MRKQLIGLGVAVLVFGFALNANAIAITNGSFETGDYSGWEILSSVGGTDSVSVTTGTQGYTATDGNYFLELSINEGVLVKTDMSLFAFSWEPGDTLSIDWAVIQKGTPLYFYAVPIISSGHTGASVPSEGEIFYSSSNAINHETGWMTTTHTFSTTGSGYYDITAQSDGSGLSSILIDNIRVSSAPVPEPATMLLFGTGLVGLVGSRIRKKK